MALKLDQENIVQLIGFYVGPKLLGADILTIREILREPKIGEAIGAPDFVEGIAQLRSQVIPIINLSNIIGISTSGEGPEKSWVLVAQAGNRQVGYRVDSVTPILRVQEDAILPAPDIILSGLRSKYIRGVSETDKGLLVVVDLERMLNDEEIQAIGRM